MGQSRSIEISRGTSRQVKSKKAATRERKSIKANVALEVLIEAGYRCAVPTCRNVLALDLHHLWQVSENGGDGSRNLIALCPYCHNLHHRGTIPAEALYAYKSLLVALTQAFDLEGVDRLLFLSSSQSEPLIVDGTAVLQFARLIASGLAEFTLVANNNDQLVTYRLGITDKGAHLVHAWKSGNREQLALVMTQESAPILETS